jgi:hypothetical protein
MISPGKIASIGNLETRPATWSLSVRADTTWRFENTDCASDCRRRFPGIADIHGANRNGDEWWNVRAKQIRNLSAKRCPDERAAVNATGLLEQSP